MMQTKAVVQTLNRLKQPQHFKAVVDLGDRHRNTLGFLPERAFETHADQGQILVALSEENTVLGYVLYYLSGNPLRTTLVHLCVDPTQRGHGVARELVHHLSHCTRHTIGIKLSCRRDYKANAMWSKLGFSPVSRKVGRSFKGHELDQWWMDHGHPNLFNLTLEDQVTESRRTVVAIDANVLFDLADPTRTMHQESTALQAHWVQPLVELVVTSEVFVEINRQPDPETQRKSQKFAQQFRSIAGNVLKVQGTAEQLLTKLNWPQDDNTLSDLKHIAHVALSQHRLFITRDQRLLEARDLLEQELSVEVLSPADLSMRLHRMGNEDVYRPNHHGGSKLLSRSVREDDREKLYGCFRNHVQQELKADFQRHLHVRLADPQRYTNQLITTAKGDPMLLVSSDVDGQALNLGLLRGGQQPFVPTLIRHLINKTVLQSAIEFRKPLTVCSDPSLMPGVREALKDNHFVEGKGGKHLRFNLHLVEPPETIAHHLEALPLDDHDARELADKLAVSLHEALARNPAAFLPQIERYLWPSKILHDAIPCFIVPIQPRWAQHLFDESLARNALFGSEERLLLNWENVYYRKPKPSNGKLNTGARILWYVSRDQDRQVGAIQACSLVEDVQVASVRELYRQHRRLGVYTFKDLKEYAHGPDEPLMAIRFSHTELLPKPITFKKFKQQRQEHGLSQNSLVTALNISTEEFARLYNMGYGR